jgi:ligand-binding sensor domain-containing protein
MIMVSEEEYAELIGAVASRDRLIAHNEALRANLDAVAGIKLALSTDDLFAAGEILASFNEDTMSALWLATSKGGIFSTKERATIRTCPKLTLSD